MHSEDESGASAPGESARGARSWGLALVLLTVFLPLFPPSLCSCGHARDAVALQPGSSHDHSLLPLHVHGVRVLE